MTMKQFIILAAGFLCFKFGFSQTEKTMAAVQDFLKKADIASTIKQNDSARYYGHQALALAKDNHLDSLQIKAHVALSNLENDDKKLLAHLIYAEQLALKTKNFDWLAKIFYRRAEFYFHKDENKIAFNNYIKLDSLSTVFKIDSNLAAMSKARIVGLLLKASNYRDSTYFPQIERHLDRGLEICDSFQLKSAAAILNLQKGTLNKFRNHYSEALNFYKRAIKISRKNKDYLTLALAYSDIGIMYAYQMKQMDSAEVNFLRANEANKMHTDTMNYANMNVQLANFYNRYSKPDRALKYLNIAQNLYSKRKEVRREHLFKLNDVATNVYFSLGKLDSAISKSKKANRFLVEMYEIQNEENVAELEARYDNASKLQQIELLKTQNRLIEKQKANQRNILLAGLLLTSILGVFFYILYINRQKTNNKLKELDTFKTNLFTNISHELRTPLTLILGPIERLLRDSKIPESIRENLSLVQHNSNRLLSLVDQMTDLAKLDSGQLQLEVKQGNLKALLEQQLAVFQYQAEQKGIMLNDNMKLRENAWFDADIIQKTTSNLLSNSIKYAPEKSNISVRAKMQHGFLEFIVRNETDELALIDSDRLFTRFYQNNNNAEGMGVGLALVKELVTLHKGTVDITKNEESNIVFKVRLPVSREAFSKDEIFENLPGRMSEEMSGPSEEDINEDTSVLLIVEDDPDIRAFVASIFKDKYHIIEAVNGKEGISKAMEFIPDLIISDIMMPEVDGIELIKTLKTQERSNHIPIILLTAKVGDEDKLLGANVGADDYTTKPFKSELLIAKVDKLIALRKQLQQRFSQEIILRPADIAITSAEELFLEKLQEIIDNNLINPSFTVESFSQLLGMSRMQLHRKLKALTGQSATEFIRFHRLKLAADLLKNSNTIVSQVGYAIGFNDHTYFTKCFRKQFGCTPTEYSNRN